MIGGAGFGSRPRMVMCYLCGREYGTKSLPIHQPQCQKKWLDAEALKPKHERKPLPKPPIEFDQVVGGVGKKGGMSIDAYNEMMAEKYDDVLDKCPYCERTFRAEAFVRHQRSCTADTPAKRAGTGLTDQSLSNRIVPGKISGTMHSNRPATPERARLSARTPTPERSPLRARAGGGSSGGRPTTPERAGSGGRSRTPQRGRAAAVSQSVDLGGGPSTSGSQEKAKMNQTFGGFAPGGAGRGDGGGGSDSLRGFGGGGGKPAAAAPAIDVDAISSRFDEATDLEATLSPGAAGSGPAPPRAAAAPPHRQPPSPTAAAAPPPGPAGGALANFCDECGDRFTRDTAKFCAMCGARRAGV